MKHTQTTEADLQASLQSFMQSMPQNSELGHSKKVKLTTVNPQTGQPMTVEMEQSTQAPVVMQTAYGATPQPATGVAVAPQSILAQALPGAVLIEKIIGGHISYIIIPVCGMVIALSYNSMSGGSSILSLAITFFLVSIIFELVAKFMTFPAVEARLDKNLATARVRLKSKQWYKEWLQLLIESIKAAHIKNVLQWSGIALAFMGCFLMMGFFLGATLGSVGTSATTSPYSTNVSQSSFMVR